jgi:hypothetical protein
MGSYSMAFRKASMASLGRLFFLHQRARSPQPGDVLPRRVEFLGIELPDLVAVGVLFLVSLDLRGGIVLPARVPLLVAELPTGPFMVGIELNHLVELVARPEVHLGGGEVLADRVVFRGAGL